MSRQRRSAVERLMSKVEKTVDCWNWTGAVTPGGYGNMLGDIPGSRLYVHRLAHQAFVGLIPVGYEIDHLCQNARCVRPDHLEAVSPEENRRRVTERRTHCAHGHAFDKDNTYVWSGTRYCRTCRSAVMKARRNAA